MLELKSSPKSGENVWLWLIKLLSGIGILVILIVHLLVNHLIPEEALLTHADVVEYYTNPWIVLMEAVFLIFVISHSLIGLRSIVLDLQPSRTVLRVVDWSFYIVGLVATVYGVWLLRAVVALG